MNTPGSGVIRLRGRRRQPTPTKHNAGFVKLGVETMTNAYLVRQVMQIDGDDVVRIGDDVVRIGGDYPDPNDLCINMGRVTGAWYDVPLPPCPDCGGDLVWWEAGYVPGTGHIPGTRKCVGQPTGKSDGRPTYDPDGGCGSLFSVQTRD